MIESRIRAEKRSAILGKWGGACLLFISLAVNTNAQKSNPDLLALVKTENDFAQKAFETSIRTAFLANLDSTGILFDNAKPINGLETYKPAPDDSGLLLSWYPTVAHISLSGDLGFTSGPYQFFAERSKGPVGSGYFFSIWKKDKNKKYKLILDAGTRNSKDHADAFKVNPKSDSTAYDFLKMAEVTHLKNPDPRQAEKMFADIAATDPKRAYTRFLADASLMLRNDRQAGFSRSINLATVDEENTSGYHFRQISQEISERGDLAYCYGEVKWGEGATSCNGFFVRVWQFQQDGWKIVAEEISLLPKKKSSN